MIGAKVSLEEILYYNKIMDRIDIISEENHNGRNRLISLDNLRYASKEMVCKEYVGEAIAKERQITINIIVDHSEKHNKTSFSDREGLLRSLTTSVNHNSVRRTKAILNESQVHIEDKTLSMTSNTKFVCTNEHTNNLTPS